MASKARITAGGFLVATLLLGGGTGATLALWSDTASISAAGTVTAGKLDLGLIGEGGSWYNVKDATRTKIADINAFRVVPGDVLEYEGHIGVALVGANLKANLVAKGEGTGLPTATGELVGTETSGVTVQTKLYTAKLHSDGVTYVADQELTPGSGNSYTQLTPSSPGVVADLSGATTPTHVVKVRLVFAQTTTNQDYMGKTLTLGNMALALEQTV